MNQDVSPFCNYCLVKSFTIVYVILACIEMTLYGELLRILAGVNLGKSKNFMKQGVLGQDAIAPIYLWPECGKAVCTGTLAMLANVRHNVSDNKLPK